MSQIKRRLKAAYENVEFHANNTWVHDSSDYQKTNQELYVREIQVSDALADEPTRPRTVQDSIPQSRLAEYANYEYNESRELCYASSASNISFYYPCICKRSCIKEPWMLPEIEQLFIWFSYAPNFDILEILRTEELAHLDEEEKGKVGRNSSCRWHDFHEISPTWYNTLERTPGKSRYTSCPPVPETDLKKFMPSPLKIETFEDMILRMKIKSDKVTCLWSEHSTPKPESPTDKNMNILKSPLGNYFVLDSSDEAKTDQHQNLSPKILKNTRTPYDHQLKTNDLGQLQILAESIRTLETLIFNSSKQSTSSFARTSEYEGYESAEAMPKTQSKLVPTRRLYSAVLQGLTADDKKQSSSTDVTSPSTSSAIEKSSLSMSSISPAKTTTSSCFSTENSSVVAPSPIQKTSQGLLSSQGQVSPPSQWISQASYWGSANSPTKVTTHTSQETKSTPVKPLVQKPDSVDVSFKLTNSSSSSTTITTSYPETCAGGTVAAAAVNIAGLNASTSPTNASGYSLSSAYLGHAFTGSNNTCFTNTYSNNNYFNNSYHVNSQYGNNFQSNSYAGTSYSNSFYANNAYQTNQASPVNPRGVCPQFNRQPYPNTQQAHISQPHSMWFVQHNRPSAICSVAHFATQPYFFLPTPPPPPPPPPPVALPARQTQRWTPSPHYVRTPSTLPSYQIPMTTTPHHWGGVQNQNLYRTNSNQQISSQDFLDGVSGQAAAARTKPKTKKSANFVLHRSTARSSEPGENTDVSSSNASTGCSSDMPPVSLASLERPALVKSVASTPSLEFRRLKVFNRFHDGGSPSGVQKRASDVVLSSQQAKFFSSDLEGSRTLLPVSVSPSDELERQALEQYQYSDENFYQDLERQAEEQYDEDRSENWTCPPSESLLFGGLKIRRGTKNCFFLSLAIYLDTNACGYCCFLLS